MLDAEDKAGALIEAILDPRAAIERKTRYEVESVTFSGVPGSPFAYWATERLLTLFKTLPAFEAKGRTAKVGLQTSDDLRFVRAWWEVPAEAERWLAFAKGGAFSRFYADIYLVANWEFDGAQMKAWAGSLYNNSHWSRILKNIVFFFRPALTWSSRTNGLSLRAMPKGCLFGHKGPAAFVDNDDIDDLLALACISNSQAFGMLVSLQLARTELAQSYEVGLIQATPVPAWPSLRKRLLRG